LHVGTEASAHEADNNRIFHRDPAPAPPQHIRHAAIINKNAQPFRRESMPASRRQTKVICSGAPVIPCALAQAKAGMDSPPAAAKRGELSCLPRSGCGKMLCVAAGSLRIRNVSDEPDD